MAPRHTGRGLVVHNGQLLLMERWRDGLHYFSIPGGGIEPGETAAEAAVREIAEETSLIVTIDRQILELHDGPIIHTIFTCNYVSGTPHLPIDSEEATNTTNNNRFVPRWIPLEDVPNAPYLYWEPLRKVIIDGLQNGFPGQVTVVKMPPTR